MWIFLARAGFYSVIQCGGFADQLVVRARDRQDLVRLKKLYLPTLGAIENTPERDYGYRSTCTKKAFAAALAKAVEAIDFPNFKAETQKALGTEREMAYHAVWAALLRLQR
jgi:hypothetical protein